MAHLTCRPTLVVVVVAIVFAVAVGVGVHPADWEGRAGPPLSGSSPAGPWQRCATVTPPCWPPSCSASRRGRGWRSCRARIWPRWRGRGPGLGVRVVVGWSPFSPTCQQADRQFVGEAHKRFKTMTHTTGLRDALFQDFGRISPMKADRPFSGDPQSNPVQRETGVHIKPLGGPSSAAATSSYPPSPLSRRQPPTQ